MVYLDGERLADCMRQALIARDVDPIAIQHVVGSLIETSLRGVDSHGVNLFPHYCRAVDGGRINPRPRVRINRTALSSATVEADHAFGHHAGAIAMDTARELAKETGVAAVAVANSTHFGAAAYFALRAARTGSIGMAFCNADALVKVHNGRESFFGTNPICICAPMKDEDPFCLDMATSLAAWNKVKNARAGGGSIPEGWAFDELGRGVTDPNLARSLAPLGGYKGFDLGMVVDILCALLANGPISKDIPPMFDSPLSTRRAISHFFMALDVSKFVPLPMFMSRLRDMADRVRSVPEIDGANGPVMVAGDPEKKSLKMRLNDGIPVGDERYAEFLQLMPTADGALIAK